jgi:predicted ATPase/DNA-binding SARP family transcriptional activator
MTELWRIELLGGLRAIHFDRVITRFRSRKTGTLLAYLAFYPQRAHSRDQLMEIVWPEDGLDSARDKLRVALCSLRRQLEPPGVAPGTVLATTRLVVQLSPAAIITDVAKFEAALRAADSSCGAERRERLIRAIELYRGPLLPNCFEAWVTPERQRLSGLFFQALAELVQVMEQEGELRQALDYAGRAVAADPLREEGQREFIRLLVRAGQPTAALDQYRRMESLLWEELREKPTAATQRLLGLTEQQAAAAPIACHLHSEADQETAPASSPAGSPAVSPPPGSPSTNGARTPEPAAPTKTDTARTRPLPLPFTRFFGRESELAALCDLLLSSETRLVTLTGPGGSGKTRLAVQVARKVLEARPDAVWWASLVDLADPHLIGDAIREAMGLPRLPLTSAVEQVAAALNERVQPSLLVIDNAEHLVEGCAALVDDLLVRAPRLRCLVTARQLLNLGSEREFPVEPLPVPTRGGERGTSGVETSTDGFAEPYAPHPTPSALSQVSSVQLFTDRAQAVRPAFQVTRRNAAAVAELCRRLEGIPLALELAAAHTRLLAPEQMLALLARRFDSLSTRRRDLPARHRTLRAAIEGSYQSLSPQLQPFFARLCVFCGGWTLEAAAAVCTDAGSEGARGTSLELVEVVSALAELRESSLVQAETDGAAMRYRMLETLREYAAEQLTAAERAGVAERHARYFAALVEEAESHLGIAPRREEWLARLDREHGNIRAAMDWCLQSGEGDLGMRLAWALRRFWWWRSHLREGQEYIHRLLTLPGTQARTALRAGALMAAGMMAGNQGDVPSAKYLYEESLAIYHELGDRRGAVLPISGLASLAAFRGDYEVSKALYQENLAFYREVDDEGEIAGALGNLAAIASEQGHLGEAWQLHQEKVSMLRAIGVDVPDGESVDLHMRQGDLAMARRILEERLRSEPADRLHDPFGGPFCALGIVLLRQGDLVTARAHLQKHLANCLKAGQKRLLPKCLEALAAVSAAEGAADRAARLFGAAEALREGVCFVLPPADRALYEAWVTTARARSTEEAFACDWAAGRDLSLDQVIALAKEPARQV